MSAKTEIREIADSVAEQHEIQNQVLEDEFGLTKHSPCFICQTKKADSFKSTKSKCCRSCEKSSKKCLMCGKLGTWVKHFSTFSPNCSLIFKDKESKQCRDCFIKLSEKTRQQQAKMEEVQQEDDGNDGDEDYRYYNNNSSNRFAILSLVDPDTNQFIK